MPGQPGTGWRRGLGVSGMFPDGSGHGAWSRWVTLSSAILAHPAISFLSHFSAQDESRSSLLSQPFVPAGSVASGRERVFCGRRAVQPGAPSSAASRAGPCARAVHVRGSAWGQCRGGWPSRLLGGQENSPSRLRFSLD